MCLRICGFSALPAIVILPVAGGALELQHVLHSSIYCSLLRGSQFSARICVMSAVTIDIDLRGIFSGPQLIARLQYLSWRRQLEQVVSTSNVRGLVGNVTEDQWRRHWNAQRDPVSAVLLELGEY